MAARRTYRVSFIGRYREGAAGQVRSLFIGLHESGHIVQEINVGHRPDLLHNPHRHTNGEGPVYVRLGRIAAELMAFRPDVVFLVGDGLTFSRRDMMALQAHAAVVGFTFAGPAVYEAVARYANLFTLHITTSAIAARWHLRDGHTNSLYLPYGVDGRFFVPRVGSGPLQAQVAVIGHATPERIRIADQLAAHCNLRLHGRGWPFHTTGPVRGDDWFQAAWSTRLLVHFPSQAGGHTSPGPGVFEGTAAGRLVLTAYLDELRPQFDYGTEIVGYSGSGDLIGKVRYYLARPGEAAAIAQAGQRRCGRDHTWARRLALLFARLPLSAEAARPWPKVGSGPALRPGNRRLRRHPTLPPGRPGSEDAVSADVVPEGAVSVGVVPQEVGPKEAVPAAAAGPRRRRSHRRRRPGGRHLRPGRQHRRSGGRVGRFRRRGWYRS